MKKILVVLMCALVMTGCGNGNTNNLETINVERESLTKSKEAFSEEENISLSETVNEDTKILHINAYIPIDADIYEYSENIGKISADIASEDWFDYEYVSVDFWDYWNAFMGKGKVSSIVSRANNGELETIQQYIYGEDTDSDNSNEDEYSSEGKADETSNDNDVNTKKSTVVYEDNNVKISFAGISEDGVEFWVDNLTDVNITIQADSVSVNGISTNDIMMSDDVAPQSKGKVVAQCDDFTSVTNVETVGGQLRVIDFNNNLESYDAKFVNIPIG